MFRSILVPLDGSALAETALPWAARLAEAFQATVHLLRVVPLRQRPGAAPLDIIDRRLGQTEAQAYLDALASDLSRRGLSVETGVTEGQPADRILELIDQSQPDLVVLTTHGTGGVSDFRLSGTASKIVSRAGTSLLLVPVRGEVAPAKQAAERRLVVALDGSKRGEWAVAAGAALARATGWELVLVHVCEVPGIAALRPLSAEHGRLVDRLTELNRRCAAAYLAEQAARLEPDLHTRTRIEVSMHVAQTLVDIAEAERADLMMLAAHGASTGREWLYGGTTMQVMAEARRPLLIVQDAPRRGVPEGGTGSAHHHGHALNQR
jgi:nucleotide-binding universal stress UspA family protein